MILYHKQNLNRELQAGCGPGHPAFFMKSPGERHQVRKWHFRKKKAKIKTIIIRTLTGGQYSGSPA